MKLFNPTFEDVELQYDSKVYKIKKQEWIEIPPWPEHLSKDLLARTKPNGIFAIYEGMTPEAIEKAKREGLKCYLEGAVTNRINNYHSHNDSLKRGGFTVEEDYNLLKAKKWKKEIAQVISYEEEKMGEESFLKPKKQEHSKAA